MLSSLLSDNKGIFKCKTVCRMCQDKYLLIPTGQKGETDFDTETCLQALGSKAV